MKRLRPALAVAMLLTVMVAFQPAQAATKKTIKKTKRYELAGAGVWQSRTDPTCAHGTCMASSDGRTDIGRLVFDPIGKKPRKTNVKVVVRDDYQDNVSKVKLIACSDKNRNLDCGEGDRVIVYACVRSGQPITLRSVERTSNIVVTIWAAWGCPRYLVPDIVDQPGGGTSGSVTITYS